MKHLGSRARPNVDGGRERIREDLAKTALGQGSPAPEPRKHLRGKHSPRSSAKIRTLFLVFMLIFCIVKTNFLRVII